MKNFTSVFVISWVCYFGMTSPAPAPFLEYIEVDDPTFSGTIYALKCKPNLFAALDKNGVISTLSPFQSDQFGFELNLSDKTIKFNFDQKVKPLEISASYLEKNYSKYLSIKEGDLGIKITIEGSKRGALSARFASTNIKGQQFRFGDCKV